MVDGPWEAGRKVDIYLSKIALTPARALRFDIVSLSGAIFPVFRSSYTHKHPWLLVAPAVCYPLSLTEFTRSFVRKEFRRRRCRCFIVVLRVFLGSKRGTRPCEAGSEAQRNMCNPTPSVRKQKGRVPRLSMTTLPTTRGKPHSNGSSLAQGFHSYSTVHYLG